MMPWRTNGFLLAALVVFQAADALGRRAEAIRRNRVARNFAVVRHLADVPEAPNA
jgi:hypothetical protein